MSPGIWPIGLLAIALILHLTLPHGKGATKALLMPLLILFYLLETREVDPWVIAALLAAWAGDVFLIKPDVPSLFLAGLASFLIGHAMWAVVFLNRMGGLGSVPLWFPIVAIPYLIGFLFVANRLRGYLTGKRIGFTLYAASLIAMSLFALARGFSVDGPAFWLPFVGSLLFLLSDATLAFHLFHVRLKYGDVRVMTTYVLAQTLIVMGLL